jgi:hypothetical protein
MMRGKIMSTNLLHKFCIKDKKAKKVLFMPKKAQIHYLQNRTGRDYILKARQMGFTTLEQLRKLKKVMLNNNITVATIAHERQKTDDIFQIVKYAWDNLPEVLRESYNVKYDNVRELYFAKGSVNEGSRYFVDLNMRSGTVHDLHISELAFVRDIDELFASTLEAVPKNGVITLETTANGLNRASEIWKEAEEGKNEFKPHFYNWAWDEDYWETPPEKNSWKGDYKTLAKKYNLIREIQQEHKLTDEQFYWYYLKTRRLGERVKQEYPTVPDEAFLTSSISVFDLFKVNQIKTKSSISKVRGVDIFKEGEDGHRYCIGVDTAEGVGGDRTAIEVWDMTDSDNIEEVASFTDDTIRPDQTAELALRLGLIYNDAFIVPERNSSGLTTVLKLQEERYPHLFVNKSIDKKTQKNKNEYGWRTTGANRDVMIDDFIELFENGNLVINSSRVAQEMKTFVRKDNGKREHDTGYHDDSLFASFLAIQGNKYQRSTRVFTSKPQAFR